MSVTFCGTVPAHAAGAVGQPEVPPAPVVDEVPPAPVVDELPPAPVVALDPPLPCPFEPLAPPLPPPDPLTCSLEQPATTMNPRAKALGFIVVAGCSSEQVNGSGGGKGGASGSNGQGNGGSSATTGAGGSSSTTGAGG